MQAYNRINHLEDVIKYNYENAGTEGANPGDQSACPTGQENFREVLQGHSGSDETYRKALVYAQHTGCADGIDEALKGSGADKDFDALLLFDRRGAGQENAAQAGNHLQSCVLVDT